MDKPPNDVRPLSAVNDGSGEKVVAEEAHVRVGVAEDQVQTLVEDLTV